MILTIVRSNRQSHRLYISSIQHMLTLQSREGERRRWVDDGGDREGRGDEVTRGGEDGDRGITIEGEE